jgi:hypothetical protein
MGLDIQRVLALIHRDDGYQLGYALYEAWAVIEAHHIAHANFAIGIE